MLDCTVSVCPVDNASSAHKATSTATARHPFAAISSNLPAGHSRKQVQQPLHQPRIPAVSYGPLSTAILSRARQQQVVGPIELQSCSTGRTRDPTHPQLTVLQPLMLPQHHTLLQHSPQHQKVDPTTLHPCSSAHAASRQAARVTSTAHPSAGPAQYTEVHACMQQAVLAGPSVDAAAASTLPAPAQSAHSPSQWQQLHVDSQHTSGEVHAALDSERLPSSSTSRQSSNTPGTSAALQRLQHKQQLRWQRQHATSRTSAPAAAGMAHAVPFTLHPAVSTLLSQHTNPLFDEPAALDSSDCDHPSALDARSFASSALGSSPAGCSPSSAPMRHRTGQPSTSTTGAAFLGSSKGLHSGNAVADSTASGAQSASFATQEAATAADSLSWQAILQRLQAAQAAQAARATQVAASGLAAGSLMELALLSDAGSSGIKSRVSCSDSIPPAADSACRSDVQAVHVPAAFPGGQHLLQPAQASTTACMAVPLTQLPKTSLQSSSDDADDYVARGPVRYADRYNPSLPGQLPGAQAQQAEHMFVKLHRSQRQQQQWQAGRYDSTGYGSTAAQAACPASQKAQMRPSAAALRAPMPSAAAPKSTAPPEQHRPQTAMSSTAGSTSTPAIEPVCSALLAQAADRHRSSGSSMGTNSKQVHAGPGTLASGRALLMDIDGLPLLQGPLTASLRSGHAGTSKAHTGSLVAVAQPVVLSNLAAQRGSDASILASYQLKSEGGSSAAAIQGIAAAPGVQHQQRVGTARGKALELLAGTAVALAARLQRQRSQHAGSRLQAASYPSAPGQQNSSAGHVAAASSTSASLGATQCSDPTCATSSAQASTGWTAQHAAPAWQHSMSNITDTLHAAAQQQRVASVPQQVAASAASSTGSNGCSASAGVAQGLQGSRLSMWQRQPCAEPSRQQLSVTGELRASITGALRSVAGAVRCSSGVKPSATASALQQPAAPPVSPGAPFLSPVDAAEVFLTPEAADSSTDDGESLLGSSSCSSVPEDILADTAQSTFSYALQPHSMGLSRGTPFVGLHHGDDHDYVLTALQEQHGKAPHAGTFWVASVRHDKALLGTRARRRLTWEKGTNQHAQHQHQATPRPAGAAQRVRRLPQGQPVQQARPAGGHER